MPEDAMTAESHWYFAGLVALFVIFLGGVIWVTIDTAGSGLILLPLPIATGWLLTRSPYQLDLRSEGDLVAHYFYGTRVIDPSDITKIKYSKGGESAREKFTLSLNGTIVRLGASDSTKRMMRTLVRLNPDVELVGHEWYRGPRRRKVPRPEVSDSIRDAEPEDTAPA